MQSMNPIICIVVDASSSSTLLCGGVSGIMILFCDDELILTEPTRRHCLNYTNYPWILYDDEVDRR